MEKDSLFTFPNRNGRQYKLDRMLSTVREWAEKNGWSMEGDKNVNAFYHEFKTGKRTIKRNGLEQYMVDPQSIFIDYIGLLRP